MESVRPIIQSHTHALAMQNPLVPKRHPCPVKKYVRPLCSLPLGAFAVAQCVRKSCGVVCSLTGIEIVGGVLYRSRVGIIW